MPQSLYAPLAFIKNRWQEQVVIEIDDRALISDIDINTGSASPNPKINQTEQCQGALIPGIPNGHSHAFQRIFAGLTESPTESLTERQTANQKGGSVNHCAADNFWSWREQMYRFAHRVTPDQQRIIAQHLYIQMLKAGYTAVGEFHYLHHQQDGRPYDNIAETSLSIIEAALTAGIRLTHLPVYYGRAGFSGEEVELMQRPFYNSIERYLLLLEALQKQTQNNAQVDIGMSLHSLRAASEQAMQCLLSEIEESMPTAVIHIHIAEQQKEVEDCLRAYGQRPVQWLLDNIAVNKNWSLIHATHVNDKELSAMIKCGASVGLCPSTEANLGDGLFPIVDYFKESGIFSIGSDSQVSIDPFEEMKWLEYSQRLSQQKRLLLTGGKDSVGQTLYKQCAEGGAQALGIDSGVIEVGKKADFVVLDTDHASSFGRGAQNLMDIAVFVEGKSLVKDVMVDGKWVVKDRHHPLEEKAEFDFKRLAALLASVLA